MNTSRNWAAVAAMLAFAGVAQASLVNRGGGMIYDTTLNVTWLADMNYARTLGYAASHAGGSGTNSVVADGRMGRDAAVAWAAGLVYGGFDDWRLPTLNASDTSCSHSFNPGGGAGLQYDGYGCTGGELSHLLVADLGNKANESILDTTGDTAEQLANLALFSNVRAYYYWSATAYAPNSGFGWRFDTRVGAQNGEVGYTNQLYALAVRSGDVAATLPEPHDLTLVAAAVAGALLARRKVRVQTLRGGDRI